MKTAKRKTRAAVAGKKTKAGRKPVRAAKKKAKRKIKKPTGKFSRRVLDVVGA